MCRMEQHTRQHKRQHTGQATQRQERNWPLFQSSLCRGVLIRTSASVYLVAPLRTFPVPAKVPPVPMAQMNPSTLPPVWAQISGPGTQGRGTKESERKRTPPASAEMCFPCDSCGEPRRTALVNRARQGPSTGVPLHYLPMCLVQTPCRPSVRGERQGPQVHRRGSVRTTPSQGASGKQPPVGSPVVS